MSLLLQSFEEDQIQSLSENRPRDKFGPGDTVQVNVRIIEGTTERVQTYEGLVIAKRNRGLHSTFTVRKMSHGEGVERIFLLYSPRIDSVKLVRRGVVRRAKLYYLRNLQGKATRIKEKVDYHLKNKL